MSFQIIQSTIERIFGVLPSFIEPNPSITAVDIHHASESHPASSYHPPNPRPPSGRLDAIGPKARITYGNSLRQNRDITPRTMGFISWWKKRCTVILNAAPFVRKKMAKEIDILDGEMHSRYDKLHGEEGLCCALVELFNAMAELRMKAEYGDYLAYACVNLKIERMSDLAWKIDRLDWQEVAERIEMEEATKAEQEARRIAPSPTPYLDDVAKAAARLGHDFDLVGYQILAYAERNNFCHSGLKAMIDLGYFQELAERLVEDKKALGVIFQGKPHDQIQMRGVIKTIEKEWFEKIWVEEAAKRRQYRYQDLKARVRFSLTDKGVEKMRKMAKAH